MHIYVGTIVSMFAGTSYQHVELQFLYINTHTYTHTTNKSISVLDPFGLRALHYAAAEGNVKMCKYLVLEAGANPNAITELNEDFKAFQMCEKRTPLHFAALNQHLAVAEFLIMQIIDCCECLVD